jgi:hypothetical protein
VRETATACHHVDARSASRSTGNVCSIVIETGAAQIDARLIDSNDPVVRWAADTLKAFHACKAR